MLTKRPTLTRACVAGVVVLATALSGCGYVPGQDSNTSSSQAPTTRSSSSSGAKQPTSTGSSSPSTGQAPAADPVTLTPSVEDHASGVKVDTVVSVKAASGTVSTVKLWTKAKDKNGGTKTVTVDGDVSADGTTWTASSGLDPDSKYRLEMQGKSASDQSVVDKKATFKTEKLGLHEQTFATIQPAKGDKVGIGMPVILNFDVPVTNKKQFEKHLSVTSTGNQAGSWSWFGSTSVHFRPKHYWKPGTKVNVQANLNGVPAGSGIYGQNSVSTHFTVGRSLVIKVNLKSDHAKVYQNGKLVKTIAVTGGKPGWRSRSGVKLIMGKEYNKVMTNEAIGAKEHYRLTAKYAMRITNSGEFLHAAPWSMANLGVRNASHGCTGMSIANAGWLYRRVLPGDPVITTGTNRGVEKGNGWSDWNESYAKYQQGSAL